MEQLLLVFLPVFVHELGHYGMTFALTGEALSFRFEKGKLWRIPVPRWVWDYPAGATDKQKKLIAQAGFGLELALACVLPWPYGAVALAHFLLYPWYAGEATDFKYFL